MNYDDIYKLSHFELRLYDVCNFVLPITVLYSTLVDVHPWAGHGDCWRGALVSGGSLASQVELGEALKHQNGGQKRVHSLNLHHVSPVDSLVRHRGLELFFLKKIADTMVRLNHLIAVGGSEGVGILDVSILDYITKIYSN